MQQYLKIAEAAKLLGMTPRAVSRLVADGRIAVHYLGPRGGMVRFTEPDLEAYLESCRQWGPKSHAALHPKASRDRAKRSGGGSSKSRDDRAKEILERRLLHGEALQLQTDPSSNGE